MTEYGNDQSEYEYDESGQFSEDNGQPADITQAFLELQERLAAEREARAAEQEELNRLRRNDAKVQRAASDAVAAAETEDQFYEALRSAGVNVRVSPRNEQGVAYGG